LYLAVLSFADLEGASLRAAELSGADFSCALLNRADFGGAVLQRTILQGATLQGASFQAAFLEEPQVWHAAGISNGKSTNWSGAFVDTPLTAPDFGFARIKPTSGAVRPRSYDEYVQDLKTAALDGVGPIRRLRAAAAVKDALARLGSPASPSPEGDKAAKLWGELVKRRPDRFGDQLLTFWVWAACEEGNAPYAFERVIERLRPMNRWGNPSAVPGLSAGTLEWLASVALDRERCPAAKKLTEADEAELRTLLPYMLPPPPPASKK
jgi:hypothetical protein